MLTSSKLAGENQGKKEKKREEREEEEVGITGVKDATCQRDSGCCQHGAEPKPRMAHELQPKTQSCNK